MSSFGFAHLLSYFPTVHSILTNNLSMTCLQTDITEADTLAQLFQWGISSDSV